jgi:hypothetical protein
MTVARAHLLTLVALALAARVAAGAEERAQPKLALIGLPARVASGQPVAVRVVVSGLPGAKADVEVTTLLADRSVGRSTWKVPLEHGTGQVEISVPLPEARSRVSLRLAAALRTRPPVSAQAEATVLPRWTADRLVEVLHGREIAVLDGDRLVAPALGTVPFDAIAATDPLGAARFRGDLLICHLPQFRPSSEGVVAALAQQLAQGRSVLWLVEEGEAAPPVLHSGPLVTLEWPFALRPGQELRATAPEDVLRWAGAAGALPLPLVASFGSAWLVVCSDRVLADLSREPAAGWLWEDVLLWVTNKPVPSSVIKHLTPQEGVAFAPAVALEPVAMVLSLRGDDWVQPTEQRVEWLGALRRFVEQGNALLVTEADPARETALRALGLPPVEVLAAPERPDLLLGPNLLLWRVARTNPSYGLLVRSGERALLGDFISGRGGPQLFAEFALGKGVVLLCQPDFDASEVWAAAALTDHLALQLLASPGRSLLGAGP